jgi:hypothetical protein
LLALLFLDKGVLDIEGVNAFRSKNLMKLPIVLSHKEVQYLWLVMV